MLLTLLLLAGFQDPVQPAPLEPALRRYRVNPEVSAIGFDGTSTLHDFTGRSRGTQGEVRFDPENLATTVGGQLRVEARTLDTGSGKRDKKMRSTLEVDEYPYIRFMIDSVTGTMNDRSARLEASGRFDIHGVERTRVLALRLSPDGEFGIRVRGESRFDISDHGMDTPGVLFVSMHDEVRAWLDVTLLPVEGPTTKAVSRLLSIRESREASETSTREERVWIAPEGLLWERASEAEWILVREDATLLLDMRRATRRSVVPGATEAAEIVRQGEHVSIRWNGVDWIELEGLAGDTAFISALALLPDLPPEVRRSLWDVHGVPQLLRVRMGDGQSVLEIRPGAEEPGRVPAWAWRPEPWTADETHDEKQDESQPRKAG
jgi:polyisoprenoid-binding protein YceI